jgi:hypothetical protein
LCKKGEKGYNKIMLDPFCEKRIIFDKTFKMQDDRWEKYNEGFFVFSNEGKSFP